MNLVILVYNTSGGLVARRYLSLIYNYLKWAAVYI